MDTGEQITLQLPYLQEQRSLTIRGCLVPEWDRDDVAVMPLVLRVYFWDNTGSLDKPNLDIRSGITNYHLDFHIGSTFRISLPISHISILRPSYQ